MIHLHQHKGQEIDFGPLGQHRVTPDEIQALELEENATAKAFTEEFLKREPNQSTRNNVLQFIAARYGV